MNRYKYRIPMFSDKGSFLEFQYVQLGDQIEVMLCGHNGAPEQNTTEVDTDNNPIYEGDIIQITKPGFIDKDNDIFYVKWVDCGFYLARGSWVAMDTLYAYSNKLYKIIGNVHENPNLASQLGYERED